VQVSPQAEAVAPPRARRRLPAAAVLPGLLLAVYVAAGWLRRFSTDDAFINFRVVKQILAGNGPVFNVGERVETTTSVAWIAILAVGDVLSPLRLEWTAVLLQLALGAIGLGAAMYAAVRLACLGQGPEARWGWAVPVGVLVYLGTAVSWDFATGGLENSLGLAWIGGSFAAVVALVDSPGARRRRMLATSVLVGLGVLVRPDFAVLSLGFAVPLAVVAARRSRRSLMAAAAAVLALPLAVQVFRMGYYGRLFPNTLYAKEGSASWWSQGWRYLSDFTGTYWLAIPLVAVAVWLLIGYRTDRDVIRRDRWTIIAALEVAAVLHAAGITRVGGDYMHGRLLLPAWFTVLLPLAAVPLARLRAPATLAATTVLLGWAAVSAGFLRPDFGSLIAPHNAEALAAADGDKDPGDFSGIIDQRSFSIATGNGDSHPVAARYPIPPNEDHLDPDLRLFDPDEWPPGSGRELTVSPDIGRTVIPYYSTGAAGYLVPLDVWVYDRLGLGDVVTGRLELEHRGTPGHEKALSGPWVAATFLADDQVVDDPDFMDIAPVFALMVGTDVDAIPDPATFADQRAAAADALGCGDLADLRADARDPLTPGRFLHNMVDSARLNGVRVPSDPAAARNRFCG
jgi:arabinofuranosyltransferase